MRWKPSSSFRALEGFLGLAAEVMKTSFVLVLGGARSGKSSYALKLAEAWWTHPLYLATAETLDEEMEQRVARHRQARGARWRNVEAPLEVSPVIAGSEPEGDGILLDCVTLWLSNVLLKEGERACERRREELLAAVGRRQRGLICVANEVGMGIVPDNALARSFRDQAGWLNQALAQAADAVVFVAAGLPFSLKGTLPEERGHGNGSR